MNRSKLGFEITAMGKNVDFAEATGMNVRKKIITIFIISGALSGIAGAGWMMSDKFVYTLDFSGSPGLGWDGMLIALLGSHSPVGILIAAIFYAALKVGSHSIAIYSNVPAEIIVLIQSLIVLFLSVKLIKDRRFIRSITKLIDTFRKERA
jgi:general nucleoside transport system permease protein